MKKKAAALILILISALLTGAVLKLSVADRSMAASGAFLYAQEPSDSDNTSDPSPAVTDDDNTMAPETSVIPETASPESDETPFETEPATEPSETEPSETEPSETEPSETETPAPTDVPTEPPTPTPTPEPTPEPLPSVEPHVNTVRIGLKFDKSALDVLTTGSDSGGTIGVLKNHLEYEPVIVFGKENSVTVRADSGYHIAVTPPLSSIYDARNEMLKIKPLMEGGGTSMLYIYDGTSWYVGAGFYSKYPEPGVPDVNGTDRYALLSERLSAYGYTLSVITVRNNGLKIYIDGSPVMILNVSDTVNKLRITPLAADTAENGSGALPPLLKLGAARYRGYFDIHRHQGGKIVLVNDVDVEDYTLSVVPAEMISGSASSWSWRKEGLKAQAILARTSAYQYVINNKLTTYGFHMDDTTNYQVYTGYINSSGESGETANTTMATQQTAGLVLSYDNKIISEVFYHSNSGGYTETPDAVWGGVQELYVSVPDPWTPPTVWSKEYTGATLSSRVVSYISNQKGVDLGVLNYLNVTQRTESGRVTEMLFEGTKNDYIVKIQQTRMSINVRGQRFTFDVDETLKIEYQNGGANNTLSDRARKYLEGNVYSTSFLPDMYAVRGNNGYTYERIRIRGASDPKQIMIRGTGTGHGVGMSQDGAEEMSKAGKTFEEIILFYIPKVQIVDVSTLLQGS